ncbi:hypothetical protein F982_03581 [Acinetobacter baumannii NIPH 1362]|uniref:hypothetical protein n=1 Tax=Acinetobacter baumannii TaxID=470 RepID=UPI0002D07A2D|nr:hypothetical protein [Acinetobacter baumannii]ENU52823.1 hypothetical protein F982_03581 [Acinetobacter baumannii NIPH 1362]
MAQQIVIEVPGTKISELEKTSSVSRGDVTPVVQNEETKQADIGQISDFVKSELGTAALKNESDFATPAAVAEASQASQMRDDAQNERIDGVEYGLTAMANGADKSFATYAQMIAYVPPEANVSVRNNDHDPELRGTYIWNGESYIPGYDPLDEAMEFANKKTQEAINFTNSSVSNLFVEGKPSVPIQANLNYGWAINTDTPQSSIFFPTQHNLRAYLKIDVRDVQSLVVSNATSAWSGWRWVFRTADDTFISMSSGIGNGTYNVPTNAVWAYRTYQVGDAGAYENTNIVIQKILKKNIHNEIEEALKENNNAFGSELREYADSLIEGELEVGISLNAIAGYSVDTTQGHLNILSPQNNDIRKYIELDVSNFSVLKVRNSLPVDSWYWVFVTNTGEKILSNFKLNGDFSIPANAVKAYRTVYYEKAPTKYDDLSNGLTITAIPRKLPVQPQITYLAQQISEILNSGGANLAAYVALSSIIKKMEEMFEQKNFISPNDFAGLTQFERVKSAIEFVRLQGYGIVELGIDKDTNTNLWIFPEALLLPSNCWIFINKSIVKRGDGVFDNVFRNDGIILDNDPFKVAKELKQNVNIRIFGNDKTDSFIDGNLLNARTAPNPITGGAAEPWISDFFGWRAISVLFANTKAHSVYNLSFINAQSWNISNEHGCESFSYHDLSFSSTVKNGDGINIRMGCKDFEIFNIEGKTSDDTIACTAIKNFQSVWPTGKYVYPSQIGGYADRGFGSDISNGKIWNIKASSAGGIRLLFSGGSKVHDISINKFTELDAKCWYYMLLIHTGGAYGSAGQMGDCFNITVNNIDSELTDKVVNLDGPLKDCWINSVTQNLVTETPAILKEASYVEENVKISNIYQAQGSP